MRLQSWRARVTSWYVLVLVFVVAALAGGGWWLMARAVSDAADRDLVARVSGIASFIDSMKTETNPQEILDEFREYGELTAGESLIEVTDPDGRSLLRPGVVWWHDVPTAGELPGTTQFHSWRSGERRLRLADANVTVAGRRYRVRVAVPTAASEGAVHRFGVLLLVLAPAVLTLAGLGVYAISGRALAPVEQIRQAAEAITVERLDRRLAVPAIDDELRRLVVTFNAMLARLEHAVADIVRFTADASHELRTPVARVRTTAEIAIDRERTPEHYRQALVEIAAESHRMSTLVDDLLRLARADAGVEGPDLHEVDMHAIAGAAIEGLASVSAAKNVSVHLHPSDAPVPVVGDEGSLVRLVHAVLDNAVKYTPSGGRVDVRTRVAERGTAVVSVSDTGSGVTADEAPRIFDRFYRGRDARARGFDGSGLGLSLARAVAERAGGSIELVRTPDAGGATFEIRLPISRAPSGSG
jgi:heavy metal sensor kinase